MKLTDYTNEDAVELLADLLDPVSEILSDDDVRKYAESGKRVKAISAALKKHKHAVIEIMARVDGVEPEEYKCNVLTLPVKVLSLLNDPEVLNFFTSQGLMEEPTSSGSATEITGETEKEPEDSSGTSERKSKEK